MAARPQLATRGKSMRSITCSFRLAVILLFLQSPALFAAENKETGKTLNDFFEAEWNYEMEQSPVRASFMGDRRWNDRWGDQSLEAVHKREEHAGAALERLKKFDRAQ